MAKQEIKALKDIVTFKNQIRTLDECETMVRYAQSQGKKVPSHVLKQMSDLKAIAHELNDELKAGNIENLDPRSLNMALIGQLHREMAKVIAPATPATVLLMEENKHGGMFGLLGPVPLVRRLNVITMLCLLTFLGLFFLPEVDSLTVNGDILSYEGMAFVYNELVILCIAALGASFYALFEVYKYITKNSYDPKYDSIYWIRFVLGIVSGVILAQFIFVSPEILGEDVGDVADNVTRSRELGGFMTYKPVLAFLGGFSARVVHKILNSMVEAIETFISGSARDMVVAREEAAKLKMQQQIDSIKLKTAQIEGAERMKSTIKLMQLKEELNYGANKDDIAFRLNQIMNEYMKPVGGVDIDFTKTHQPVQPTTSKGDVPIVEDNYQPEVVDNFDEPIVNDKGEVVEIKDVDTIDIPDFPDDLDNPDFPMPGDIKDDFDPNDPNLKV
ncbi:MULTISPECIES: hypothetical protein [unclassified Aureispira]|uniref:hypothetical protein n=1 Tax=unclassified Aureispira TaxID=2649989 RepID=UPI000695F6AF|nr:MULTISPECIES: hypothetical protein [unclassified Aureispira]WMX13980.1 hypothetical protein QP953_24300 [Aureispira sp. CCB-E]